MVNRSGTTLSSSRTNCWLVSSRRPPKQFEKAPGAKRPLNKKDSLEIIFFIDKT